MKDIDAAGLNAFCNDYDSIYLTYKDAEKNNDTEKMESLSKELLENSDKIKDGDELER